MKPDPITVAMYRSEQERLRQWVRIEDAQRQHDLSDGQIINAWRKGRIAPRVYVPQSEFYDTAGGCFVHLGDYPLQVDEQHLAQFSAEGEAQITRVSHDVVLGDPEEWNGGLYIAPDGRCMVDYGRSLVLSTPIKTRLGALWIDADEVARLIEQPAEEVLAEGLRDTLAPEPAAPPRGQKQTAQKDALVQVIQGMGYDPMNIPNNTKKEILAECVRLHPELFPPRTGALHAWKKASIEGRIRHIQNLN